MFEPILRSVWQYVASDADEFITQRPGPKRRAEIVELVIDANRPQTCGGMKPADEKRLYECNRSPKTKKWLHDLFSND